jgi:ArsR family transcriptional regulator
MATDVFPDQALAARRFQALSDQTRLEIVSLLAGGERCVCELTDALDAAQSRLSFHLKVLKGAGLVVDRREGRWSYYSLNHDVLESTADLVRALASDGGAGAENGCCG